MASGPAVIGFDGTAAAERAVWEAGNLLAPRRALVVVAIEEGATFDEGPIGRDPRERVGVVGGERARCRNQGRQTHPGKTPMPVGSDQACHNRARMPPDMDDRYPQAAMKGFEILM